MKKLSILAALVIIAAVAVIVAPLAHSDTVYITGNLEDGTSWTGGAVPTSANPGTVNLDSTITAGTTFTDSVITFNAGDVTAAGNVTLLNSTWIYNGSVSHTNASGSYTTGDGTSNNMSTVVWNSTGELFIPGNLDNKGTFTQNSGTVRAINNIFPRSGSTYNLAGGMIESSDYMPQAGAIFNFQTTGTGGTLVFDNTWGGAARSTADRFIFRMVTPGCVYVDGVLATTNDLIIVELDNGSALAFRVEVTAIAPIPQNPATISNIESISGGTQMGITWAGEAAASYTVQTNSDLIVGDWQDFTSAAGTGVDITVTNDVGPNQTFYRIITN